MRCIKFDFRQLGILFLLSFMFTSCEYEIIEPAKIDLPDVVSFSTDIVPIFNNSCNMSGCHVAGHFKVDLTPDNAYQDLNAKNMIDLASPADSKLYVKLIDGGTHNGRSTAADQALILKWIEEGAKDN